MGKHRTIEQRIADLEARILVQRAKIERRESTRVNGHNGASAPPPFSPGSLVRHRRKLGLSAADYGRLVGVSALTIYNWEKGRAQPRKSQREKLSRALGVSLREARSRLIELELPR